MAITGGIHTLTALQPTIRQLARQSTSGRNDGNFPTYYDPDDEDEGYYSYDEDDEDGDDHGAYYDHQEKLEEDSATSDEDCDDGTYILPADGNELVTPETIIEEEPLQQKLQTY